MNAPALVARRPTWLQKAAEFVIRQLSLVEVSATVDAAQRATSGEIVTQESVLGLSAAWACVNLLAGTIASLPLMVYRTDGSGARTVARDHPLYRLLHDSPNADQTAVDYWEFKQACVELRGSAVSEIARGSGGRIVALTPIGAPVNVRRISDGTLEYSWTDGSTRIVRRQEDVFHLRGFGGSPLGGLSTLAYGRQTFGLASALERAASATFANGLKPSGVLTFDKFLTPDQRGIVETHLVEKFTGAHNSGRPMVLEGGTKWEALSITPEDAQMLQSRALSVEEVCRMFGVPPIMVGHGEKTSSWGTGVQEVTLGFVKYTLRRRLKRIEMAVEKQLLTPADRAGGISVEFNMEGLLRGDSAARSAFYQQMTQIGAMTINEVRALENLPPVDGGDEPRMQMQNVPITQAGQPAHGA